MKSEIKTRLEYALTSGENLEYAVNSMVEYVKERDKQLLEEVKKMIDGMKRGAPKGGGYTIRDLDSEIYCKGEVFGWDDALTDVEELITNLLTNKK